VNILYWFRTDDVIPRLFVDNALAVWEIAPRSYEAEIARTTFLKAKILYQHGDQNQAKRLFRQAVRSRSKIRGEASVDDGSLTEEDFDGLVTFWSR